jgi:hypothetical protein
MTFYNCLQNWLCYDRSELHFNEWWLWFKCFFKFILENEFVYLPSFLPFPMCWLKPYTNTLHVRIQTISHSFTEIIIWYKIIIAFWHSLKLQNISIILTKYVYISYSVGLWWLYIQFWHLNHNHHSLKCNSDLS